MPFLSHRRAWQAALFLTIAVFAAPAAASASTWTVDDDKAQCPSAGFTSIQAAVDQAAPSDTIIICQGLYLERSVPASGVNSFAQPGSQNGLTITKPLTIKGAGANKVTIRPAPIAGSTLAGTAPYLRDGGGNVITISRQSLGSSDETENFVDLSGVTVDSPDAYAEAGVAFFNTSGRISNSTIGPLRRSADATELAAKPHGYGVIQTDSLLGAEAGPRRSLTIQNSLITGYQSGGVLFDDATGTDGNATNTVSSGLPMYGTIAGSRIVGSGSNAIIPQNGVKYAAGARGSVTGSEITGNYYQTAAVPPVPAERRQSVGILLTGADTSAADPQNPAQPSFRATGNLITSNGYGLFNADISNTAAPPRLGAPAIATGNWWGCAAGPTPGAPSAAATATTCQGISGNDANAAPSVTFAPVLAAAPPALVVPGATADTPPTVSFSDPVQSLDVPAGVDAIPTLVAADDFGITSVKLSVDGQLVASKSTKPYVYSWTPPYSAIGSTVTLRALATDSSAQTTLANITVHVVAPDGYVGLATTSGSVDVGSVPLDHSATGTVGLVNTGQNPLNLTTLDVTGAGFSLGTGDGTCAAATTLAVGKSCTLTVAFTPTTAGAATGSLTVTSTGPGAPGPIVVPLSGTGTALPAPPPPVTPPVPALIRSAPPTLVGTGLVGLRITCLPGTWKDTTGFTYGWTRDGKTIAGASGSTYSPVLADIASVVTCKVRGHGPGGASGLEFAAGHKISFAAVAGSATRTSQLGGAILKRSLVPKVKKRTITLGSVSCPRAAAHSCKVTVTGALRAGGHAFALSTKVTVKHGDSEPLVLKLGAKADKALKSTGRLSLRFGVVDDTGLKGYATVVATAVRA